MDLVAIARRAFLTSVRNDLLADAVVFDVAISVLPMKIFFHRRLHALDATMFEVCESDDMTKHGAIRIDSCGIIFEINSTKREGAEERDENAANQCTTASAMRVHLVAGSFTTG